MIKKSKCSTVNRRYRSTCRISTKLLKMGSFSHPDSDKLFKWVLFHTLIQVVTNNGDVVYVHFPCKLFGGLYINA